MVNGRKTIKVLAILLAVILFAPFFDVGSSLAFAREDGQDSFIYDVIEEDVRQKSRVHAGGFQIGFTLNVNGVVVSDFNEVDTAGGYAKLRSELRCGDVIKYVNGCEVSSSADITAALDAQIEPNTLIIASRYGKMFSTYVEPLIERVSGALRLGLSVRDEIGGIGTVTYVTQDGSFGALGHSAAGEIADSDIEGGKVYKCKISGVEKGRKGCAGSVSGSIDKSEEIGTVERNTRFGVYGRLREWDGELVDTQRKNEIKTGGATVRCNLFGGASDYSIEIVKTNYQPDSDEKGMVIRMMDKALLELSGGIIQGMSGSPIIKDGKLIGAVTHVFINDPTRGYGIYVDSMLTQTAA